jgi:upstream activation factor subunit UAF30
MANKKQTKTASNAENTMTERVEEPVQKKKTQTKRPRKKEETVVEEEEAVVEETVDDSVDEESPKQTKKRPVPTKESIVAEFEELINSVEAEITSIRENKTKSKGIKFLRTLNKRLKSLKVQTTRIKQRSSTVKKDAVNNSNSGFLKPVKISTEMAKFTGWDVNELKSRVDVTKYLCNYIKENELQNPKDRRQIIADAKLAKLIKFDPKKESEPLTYYRLQTYLKNHFIKPEVLA